MDPDSHPAVTKSQHCWLEILQSKQLKTQKLLRQLKVKPLKKQTMTFTDGSLTLIYGAKSHRLSYREILRNGILVDSDTPEWDVMKECIEKLTKYCKENKIPFIMGFSGGKGIHLSIFFKNDPLENEFAEDINRTDIDVFKTARGALFIALAENAGIDLYDIGMDWGEINFREFR